MAKKPRVQFVIERAKNKQFFVKIVLANGRQTFTSGEQYERRQGCQRAIDHLIKAIDQSEFEIVDNTKEKA